jgi:hypothetical protein
MCRQQGKIDWECLAFDFVGLIFAILLGLIIIKGLGLFSSLVR